MTARAHDGSIVARRSQAALIIGAVTEPEIRNISDTARWMAAFRAQETARPDAVFRDPFARALAGDWGERNAEALASRGEHAWPFITRTYLFDRYVTRLVDHGVDLV